MQDRRSDRGGIGPENTRFGAENRVFSGPPEFDKKVAQVYRQFRLNFLDKDPPCTPLPDGRTLFLHRRPSWAVSENRADTDIRSERTFIAQIRAQKPYNP